MVRYDSIAEVMERMGTETNDGREAEQRMCTAGSFSLFHPLKAGHSRHDSKER